MPKLFRKIPVRVKLANSKFPEAGKNLRILEVERVEMLGEIQKPHLLAMFIILVYMRPGSCPEGCWPEQLGHPEVHWRTA